MEVLTRLRDAGVLQSVVLVGSWCLPCYREYFQDTGKIRTLRTRDLDLAISIPPSFPRNVDIPQLLDELDFITTHRGEAGYMMLEHPDLFLEFLVPERGRGTTAPYDLPQLGMNAQRLRYMDLALQDTMSAELEGIRVTVPRPEYFALHKLLIANRREDEEKRLRDLESAENVLSLMIDKGEVGLIIDLYESFNQSWKRTIRKTADDLDDSNVKALFQ